MNTIVCRPMVVKVVTMTQCDATYRWPSDAGYATCGGSFRSLRRNWPHAHTCIGITSVASSEVNGKLGLRRSVDYLGRLACRWQTSLSRFDNDGVGTASPTVFEPTGYGDERGGRKGPYRRGNHAQVHAGKIIDMVFFVESGGTGRTSWRCPRRSRRHPIR